MKPIENKGVLENESIDMRKFYPRLNQEDNEDQSGVTTVIKKKIKRPSLYKILLHNDDYTTMEFVIYILKKFFGKSMEDAQKIMMKVHMQGTGVCGIYTFEIAETKVSQVMKVAKSEGHPLVCTMEEL